MMTGRSALASSVGCGLDCRGIAPQPRPDPRRLHQVDVAFRLEDVAGKRQENRPGGRRERRLGGTVHEAGQVAQPVHLRRPFDEGTRQRRQVGGQDRLGGDVIAVLLAGGDENRRCGLLRVVEHAHGVAEAGRDMEVEDREPAGCLGIAVRHRHQGCFLETEHVANVISVANASISASSVVPGFPNSTSTPSCLSSSRKARFPDIAGKVDLPRLRLRRLAIWAGATIAIARRQKVAGAGCVLFCTSIADCARRRMRGDFAHPSRTALDDGCAVILRMILSEKSALFGIMRRRCGSLPLVVKCLSRTPDLL